MDENKKSQVGNSWVYLSKLIYDHGEQLLKKTFSNILSESNERRRTITAFCQISILTVPDKIIQNCNHRKHQGKNSSWLMIYIYLVIYAHHVSLLGEVIKFKCMLDSFIKAHSWGFWTTEAPYNFCLFSWQFVNMPQEVMEILCIVPDTFQWDDGKWWSLSQQHSKGS